MKRFRNIPFYFGILGIFIFLMYWIVRAGRMLESGKEILNTGSQTSYFSQFIETIGYNLVHPVALILAQIVTIIIISRIFAYLFHKIHQPAVIGEIIAGIALGPSLLGSLFPGFSSMLFPENSLGNLNLLSQFGLILFMFIVGMELDVKVIKNKIRDAVAVSNAGILIPFSLGMWLAYFIYSDYAPSHVSFLSFGLFLGLAMSITAFPVLARIVQERGIHKTPLGTLILTCAATDDITAWCLLAAIIAVAKAGTFLSSLYIILLSVVYVLIMIKVIKPFLKRLGDIYTSRENLSKPVVAVFFLTLLISAYTTELIGIHALFGAFLAGTVMPDNARFRNVFIQKIDDIALVMLLPLFFVFTGLRTQIGLLNDTGLWKVTGMIVLVAVTGKFAGTALTSRIIGLNWRNSLTIGALMNTRGLMELVVLNIGYDLGILSPEIFSMMVIMALVTTFMTGPALDLIEKFFREKQHEYSEDFALLKPFKILLSFGKPEMGRSLLRLANGLTGRKKENATVSALHLCPNNVLHHYNIDEYEAESFAPIKQESQLLEQKIHTIFKATDNIDNDIKEITNDGGYDLLLVGIGQSVFEGSFLGKILDYTTRFVNPNLFIHKFSGKSKTIRNLPVDSRTQNILAGSNVPVGILVDKNFEGLKKVVVLIRTENDGFLLKYVQLMLENSDAQITIIDSDSIIKNHQEMKEVFSNCLMEYHDRLKMSNLSEFDILFFSQFKLMVVSTDGWKNLVDRGYNWLDKTPSILMIRE